MVEFYRWGIGEKIPTSTKTQSRLGLEAPGRARIQGLYPVGVQARMFHESPAATADSAVLPGVLGCRPLRRTVQVRLGSNPLRLPGGTAVFAVSRQQFMKHTG
ncbi:MAG: hypothetical protein JRC67_08830 [Deltaproteobacteria bacterium]|nr:hypothetical protein [Deltaproteobacteria bacterium]